MTRAQEQPEFPPAGAPVSLLVDFDGTISRRDVTDLLLSTFASRSGWQERDRAYMAGGEGSRDLMTWYLSLLPDDAALLRTTAAEAPLDAGFARLVGVARRWGAAVEVVSDGLGFPVAPALDALGVGDVPVATNETTLDEPDRTIRFPYGHPACFVCGTCKRERVRAHQAARRAVVFIGDGASDRFAAAHADIVFAKGALAATCAAEGWPFHAWDSFDPIAAWIDEAVAGGRLPASAAHFDEWRGRHAPGPRPFICGPEVWGPGRTTPGPGPGGPGPRRPVVSLR